MKRVGVVGGRGVVGKELLEQIEGHPELALAFVAGKDREITAPENAKSALAGVDAVILAAKNGESDAWVRALEDAGNASAVVVDVSSDHRFDDAWVYGLPERNREEVRGAKRIANPGCYATGAQLGLDPFLDVIAGVPAVFGVSGYSGAGASPSPKNDVERLRDNLMPYDLVGHTHEKEIGRHLRPVAFMPHVAPFYVGITLTITAPVAEPVDEAALRERARARWRDEPLVRVVDDIPEVKDARGTNRVTLGGIHGGNDRVALVVTLDNLKKGAATQALQNLNLALGLPELTGIEP